jgi:hypothetical protein
MANPDEWAAWRSGVAQPGAPNVDWGDVGASAISGLQKVPAIVGGTIGDLQHLGDSGVQAALRAAGMSEHDVAALARNAQASRRLMHTGIPGIDSSPTSGELQQQIEHITGPQHVPTTTPGRYAQTIAEFTTAMLAPGGPVTRIARAVVPGVASEAAGEATEGTPLEPWARMAGGVAGGLGVEGARFAADTPNRMGAAATEGMTSQDMAAAQHLRQTLAAVGIDITVAEAAQQVTQGGTGMAGLQDFVETSRHGAPVMAPYLRNRPQQMENAVTNFANRVAPPTPNPSALGPRMQGLASDELNDVRRGINQRAEPNYQGLSNEHMPQADFDTLMADPAFARAFAAVRNDPMLNHGFEMVDDTNLSLINRVVQQIRQMGENATPNPTRDTGSHLLASQFGNAANSAQTAASHASQQTQQPSNWDEAHRIVREGRTNELDPLEAGPLGGLSRSPSLNTGIVFPTAPPAGGAGETVDTISRLGARDPEATRQFARQHVLGGRGGAQEQMQDLSGGPNQFAGARWAANIAGNPEQERALIEGFRALPGNGAQLADELATLVEGGQATGRRIPRGSGTFSRTEARDETRRLLPDIRRIGGDIVGGQRIRTLAEFLTAHPDETEAVLRQMRSRGTSFRMPLAEAVLARQPEPAQ